MTKLTRPQMETLKFKFEQWEQSKNEASIFKTRPRSSYLAYRRTAFLAFGDCVMVPWCGMVLGIEKDGYCHS